ncbi:MAG TPA: HEPN domain-containing protein [Gemmatimonadaceae bacterium]|nr:HEPN domain-containing protein [Gemmatimonadaceae bacterium]
MTDFVSKRLAKSERALTSARREVASGDLDFAAERAYYAMFYAAEALLAHHQLRYRSHGAVQGAIGQHFVKPGLLGVEHHRALLDAFEARQLATYGVDPEIGQEQAQLLIERAEALLTAVRALVEKQGSDRES